jgi:branched-subunit amino acid transport protein
MQVIPIVALVLELGSRRISVLRDGRTRLGILVVIAALYLAVIAVLTVQALSGQSIVHPDAAIATVSIALFLVAGVAAGAIVVRGRRLS